MGSSAVSFARVPAGCCDQDSFAGSYAPLRGVERPAEAWPQLCAHVLCRTVTTAERIVGFALTMWPVTGSDWGLRQGEHRTRRGGSRMTESCTRLADELDLGTDNPGVLRDHRVALSP